MSALAETIAGQGDELERLLELDLGDAAERLAPARRLWLVGTGTSQHAAELGARMLGGGEREVQWRSSAEFAGGATPLRDGDAVIVISHTAESAFARRSRARALAAGARVVTITGRDRGWPEAIETVTAERSETYTASYLAALLVLARLSLALGTAAFDPGEVHDLPALVREAAAGPPLAAAPHRLLVLTGAGPAAVTAREGALKLREAARIAAEGFEAEYLLHGSAVPLRAGDALIALAPEADPSGLVDGLAAAAAAEGIAVTRVGAPPGVHPLLAQFPLTVRLQVLAARLAQDGGVDPDTVITGAWAAERLWRA